MKLHDIIKQYKNCILQDWSKLWWNCQYIWYRSLPPGVQSRSVHTNHSRLDMIKNYLYFVTASNMCFSSSCRALCLTALLQTGCFRAIDPPDKKQPVYLRLYFIEMKIFHLMLLAWALFFYPPSESLQYLLARAPTYQIHFKYLDQCFCQGLNSLKPVFQ